MKRRVTITVVLDFDDEVLPEAERTGVGGLLAKIEAAKPFSVFPENWLSVHAMRLNPFNESVENFESVGDVLPGLPDEGRRE
jgi:hypothetical protein